MARITAMEAYGPVRIAAARIVLPVMEAALSGKLAALKRAEARLAARRDEAAENLKAAHEKQELNKGTPLEVFERKLPEDMLPQDKKRVQKASDKVEDALFNVMLAMGAVNQERYILGKKEAEVADYKALDAYEGLAEEWDEEIHPSGDTLFDHFTPEEEARIDKAGRRDTAQHEEEDRSDGAKIDMTDRVLELFYRSGDQGTKRRALEGALTKTMRAYKEASGNTEKKKALKEVEIVTDQYLTAGGTWRRAMDTLTAASGDGKRFQGGISYRFDRSMADIGNVVLAAAEKHVKTELGPKDAARVRALFEGAQERENGFVFCLAACKDDRHALSYIDVLSHRAQLEEAVSGKTPAEFSEKRLAATWAQAGFAMPGTVRDSQTAER